MSGHTLTLDAPAKINLYLDVLSRRPDGYHNIDSIMQSVSLCDTLTVSLLPGSGTVSLICSDHTLTNGGDNLAYRAAAAFLSARGITDRDVGITLNKRIPVAAGLAGGSADAAGVLSALATLTGTEREILFPLAAALGADVPFCLLGGCARAQGIGERLTPLDGMPGCFFLIACDGEGVSTPAAFAELDAALSLTEHDTPHGDIAAVLSAINHSPRILSGALYNSFHDVILSRHAQARRIAAVMLQYGALAAQLSGSGPSVFGLFEDLTLAGCAAAALTALGIDSFIAKPVNSHER